MSTHDDESIRERLRGSLRSAMKARDATAITAYRSALGAIDNAEAVEPSHQPSVPGAGPIAGAVAGLGTGEVPRHELDENQIEEIVRSEADQKRAAALQYDGLGRPDLAARLRDQAAILATQLAGNPLPSARR